MPPYQLNPINDFYMRNAIPQPQINFPQRQMPQVNVRFVTSVDEAKAALIDGFSTNLFLDSGNGKIYLKKMNNNGLADFIVYEMEETKSDVAKDPMKEINDRLSNIERFLGGLKNEPVPSDAGDGQPVAVSCQAVAVQNEPNGFAEPRRISKNERDDVWEIRS